MDQKQVEVQKLYVLEEMPPQSILNAFTESAKENLQLSWDWLVNLSKTSLREKDTALLYIATLSEEDFFVLPVILRGKKLRALSNFYSLRICSTAARLSEPATDGGSI